MTASIVGLGYCGWDHLCVLPTIPFDDKVKIIESLEQGGGPSATAIYAAQMLGSECAFMGVVGDDAQGLQIIGSFRKIGVDTHAIQVRPNVCSPTAFCWIEQATGKRSIAWTNGSCHPLDENEIDFDLIKKAKLLHLDGHQTAAAIKAAEIARENGVLVSIDAGTVVPNIDKLLALSDIVIASEKFVREYCRQDDPLMGAKALFISKTTKFAAVTAGAKGSYGYDGCNEYFQKAISVQVVDTTGAGDVYHGAFISAVVNGSTWVECMKIAALTAAIKCTKLGGRTGIPNQKQLTQALAHL